MKLSAPCPFCRRATQTIGNAVAHEVPACDRWTDALYGSADRPELDAFCSGQVAQLERATQAAEST